MAIEGSGTVLAHAATALTELIDLTPPEPEVSDIETTHMTSTDKFKTYIPGYAEPGELGATFNYVEAQHTALLTLLKAQTVEVWKITWSSGATWECSGYLKKLGTPTEREGKVTATITVKLTGVPTFTAAP